MKAFSEFVEKYGPAYDVTAVDDSMIAKYSSPLPVSLLQHWTEEGWGGYGKGLFWTVNPDEYTDLLRAWTGSDSMVAFLRTAFGQLFYWDGLQAHLLDLVNARQFELGPHVAGLFDGTFVHDKNFLEDVLDKSTFTVALRRLGRLRRDECYGYFPAIALGGPGTPETLQKVKLREHLWMLMQVSRTDE